MGGRHEEGKRTGCGIGLSRIGALVTLGAIASAPSFARTAIDLHAPAPTSLPIPAAERVDAIVRDTLDAMLPVVPAPPRAEPSADGRADWIVPRTLRVLPPRAFPMIASTFPSAGSAHESRALFGTVDGRTFRSRDVPAQTSSLAPFALVGIGFPNVEHAPTTTRRHHRRFLPLLDWHDDASVPHAGVRCMNLPSNVVARRAAPYTPAINELAAEHDLAPSLVMAVVARESCFDPRARSRAGAMGLMQLMPATARELMSGDPWTPANNLEGGVRYLAEMHALFGSTEIALAAYNAGPGNVRRYGGIPPFAETRAYVRAVLAYERRYRALELFASL